jgi:hypothetical protein
MAIHLKLEPYQKPLVYNLRDLWVAQATARICKAKAEWRATVMVPTVTTVTLDLNSDGYIDRYRTFATAHVLIGTISATQSAAFTDIAPIDESVWAKAQKNKQAHAAP